MNLMYIRVRQTWACESHATVSQHVETKKNEERSWKGAAQRGYALVL